MRTILTTICFLLCAVGAYAQGLQAAGAYVTTPVATNTWSPFAASAQTVRIFSVTAANSSASDIWLHLCDSQSLPANGTAAHFAPIKVTAGTTGYFDFNVSGLPFTNGLTVVNSTTDRHITNGAASLIISVVYTRRP